MCLAYFVCLCSGCTFLHTSCWRNRISRFRADECPAGGLIGPQGKMESKRECVFFSSSSLNQHSGHSHCSRVCFNVTATARGRMNHSGSLNRRVNHSRCVYMCVSVCVWSHVHTTSAVSKLQPRFICFHSVRHSDT